MTIRPLQDRVLVRRKENETKTAGGIIIPDTASKDKPQEGEVIAVGNGKKNENGNVIPVDVQVGDKILFTKWGGTEVKVNDEELLILEEKDIVAVVAA